MNITNGMVNLQAGATIEKNNLNKVMKFIRAKLGSLFLYEMKLVIDRRGNCEISFSLKKVKTKRKKCSEDLNRIKAYVLYATESKVYASITDENRIVFRIFENNVKNNFRILNIEYDDFITIDLVTQGRDPDEPRVTKHRKPVVITETLIQKPVLNFLKKNVIQTIDSFNVSVAIGQGCVVVTCCDEQQANTLNSMLINHEREIYYEAELNPKAQNQIFVRKIFWNERETAVIPTIDETEKSIEGMLLYKYEDYGFSGRTFLTPLDVKNLQNFLGKNQNKTFFFATPNGIKNIRDVNPVFKIPIKSLYLAQLCAPSKVKASEKIIVVDPNNGSASIN